MLKPYRMLLVVQGSFTWFEQGLRMSFTWFEQGLRMLLGKKREGLVIFIVVCYGIGISLFEEVVHVCCKASW